MKMRMCERRGAKKTDDGIEWVALFVSEMGVPFARTNERL